MCETRRKFMALGTKAQCEVAGAITEEIKEIIYKHADQIPYALVLGILRVVENDITTTQNSEE